jgi:hypothetical protein
MNAQSIQFMTMESRLVALDNSFVPFDPSKEPERLQWVDPETNQLYWLTAEELVEKGKNGG